MLKAKQQKKAEVQLFKLQTQIRAQLNNLRRSYHNITGHQHKDQRKHFPHITHRQSLSPNLTPQPNKSNQFSPHSKRPQRRHVSPVFGQSPRQPISKRHFNQSYTDRVKLQQASKPRRSAYLKDKSPVKQKNAQTISFFCGQQKSLSKKAKFTKIMHQTYHTYDKQFFR